MGFPNAINRTDKLAVGELGCEVIDDTGAHTGVWGALQVVNAAVIASITVADVPAGTGMSNSAGITGITLDGGLVIFAHVTAITLTSGVVVMYKKRSE